MDFQQLLQRYKEKFKDKPDTNLTERQEIMSKIILRLETDRKTSGYKPLTAGTYAIKMAQAGIKTVSDFYWFDAYLNDSKNYCATWWWYIREKKIKK